MSSRLPLSETIIGPPMRLVMTRPAIKNNCDEFCRLVFDQLASHCTDSMLVILIPSSPFTIYLTPLSPYFLVCLGVVLFPQPPHSVIECWWYSPAVWWRDTRCNGRDHMWRWAIGNIYAFYLFNEEWEYLTNASRRGSIGAAASAAMRRPDIEWSWRAGYSASSIYSLCCPFWLCKYWIVMYHITESDSNRVCGGGARRKEFLFLLRSTPPCLFSSSFSALARV